MLRYRLLVGASLIALLAGLCRLDATHALNSVTGEWLFPIALILCVLASGEIVRLMSGAGLAPSACAVYVGNFLIVGSNAIPAFANWSNPQHRFGWPLCAFAVAMLVAFVFEVFRYIEPGQCIKRLAATVFSFAYVGILLTFVVQVAFGPGNSGMLALISLIAVVKMGDTGAYTIGRIFGRHKMTPRLSPGKTWEGAAGAMLFGVLGSAAVFLWLAPAMQHTQAESLAAWRWIVFGLVIAIVGMVGDLAESLLKRDAGCKDSSTWLPGLGGVLDILDSILFAAPIAYLCWAAGLVR
jgi:phosphatidate cytidylyltransferase